MQSPCRKASGAPVRSENLKEEICRNRIRKYQNQQYNQSPFRLFEGMLPTGAKNLVRGTYGVIGVAALALGICLLVWPGITLKVAAIVLGIYFLISGVVRIVSSLVEMGLPAGWRILGVLIGIILVIGGIVIFKNVTMSTAMLAIMFTLIVGICWIMEGVMALAESWSVPSSGWGDRLRDHLDHRRLRAAVHADGVHAVLISSAAAPWWSWASARLCVPSPSAA